MFRFWYRFILANISIIMRGAVDLAYKRIEPQLSDYMGNVYEDICGQYLWKRLINGECKWTNEKADLGVLEILVKRSQLFHYNNTYLYLFSKNGFTEGCEEEAEKLGNVSLVTFRDIMDYMCVQ